MATVRLSGGPTLSYQEWGRPDGAVVLMLHGLESSSASWRHVGPAIGDRFRVIAPDARGHGASEWTSEYSLELMRDDVVRLMEAIGVLGAIVVGHSMGALTAYLLAATRPELVRLLVLEEMPPPDPAQPPLTFPRQPELDDEHDWRAVIAVRRWRNNPPPSWWDLAGDIAATTLVVSGAQSHVDQDRMKELVSRMPHASFSSLGGDHSIHVDRPSEFLKVLEPFISRFAK
jgi:pimeloyl-ACP methyl ester carboxylesterase